MKKLLLLFALVISVAAPGVSQNANRSGVFVEAGTGFLVGSVPISKVEWKNNTLKGYKPGDPDINLTVGYRKATSSVFAYGVKAEFSTAPKSLNQTLVLAVMPGIRYTTRELFGNTSLYFGFDTGIAMGYRQEAPYSIFNNSGLEWDTDEQFEVDSYFGAIGAKFSISAGFNVTTSFYSGLYWDYNVLSNQIFSLESLGKGGMTSNWGSLGIRLGYRF